MYVQVEGGGAAVKLVVPVSTERKKNTRYRDSKVVTTTGGAKVLAVIESDRSHQPQL